MSACQGPASGSGRASPSNTMYGYLSWGKRLAPQFLRRSTGSLFLGPFFGPDSQILTMYELGSKTSSRSSTPRWLKLHVLILFIIGRTRGPPHFQNVSRTPQTLSHWLHTLFSSFLQNTTGMYLVGRASMRCSTRLQRRVEETCFCSPNLNLVIVYSLASDPSGDITCVELDCIPAFPAPIQERRPAQ
jgi:hypothetical protein